MKLYTLPFLLIFAGLQFVSYSVESNIEKMSKEIVRNLAAKKYEEVRKDFSEDLKQQLKREQLEPVWISVISNLGEFESITSISTEVKEPYHIVHITCKFQKGNATVQSTFNVNEEVVGLFIRP